MDAVTQTYLDAIDARVAARSLLLHPFYQAWSRGELTLDALRDYSKQYYHHVAAFPTYLSAVHAQTDDLFTRRHILDNLMDEEAGDPNHPQLWLQFAEGLGVSPEETRRTPRWDSTHHLIRTFRSVCSDHGTAAGLAALYAYESQIPAVAQSKIDGLNRFYGMTDPRSTAYFTVHIEADREHAAIERQLLEAHANADNASVVMESVDTVLDALWDMLSGVCERHTIAG